MALHGCAGGSLRVIMLDTLSGTNDYTVELVHALVEHAPLTLFTVQGSRLAGHPALDLRAVFPAFGVSRWALWKAWRTLVGYAQLFACALRAPQRTVLHVQFLRHERTEAVLLRLLQRVGVCIVFTAHNALPHGAAPWHRAFFRRWYRTVDAVQVLSAGVQAQIEHGLQVVPRRVQRIGHGPYDGLRRRFGRLDRDRARAALHWDPKRFVLLQFGLFKPYKGLDRLAQAVCALPSSLRPAVALCGGGPASHLRAVRERFERGGRSADLWWHDRFADDATLCRMIVAADVIVFPYDSVSQSGALVLALSLDKACLCSDLAGFREVMQDPPPGDEESGTAPVRPCPSLVADPDPQAWAQALATLMRDPGHLQALKAQGRRAAQRLSPWSQVAAQTWQLWREVRGCAQAAVPPRPTAR